MTVSYTLYNRLSTRDGGTFTVPNPGTNAFGDPRFADAAGGDYHLQAGSPALDRGNAALLAPGELDLDGLARSLAATCGATVLPDLGAYERATPTCGGGTPGAGPPGGGGGAVNNSSGAVRDRIAPLISGFGASNKKFAVVGVKAKKKKATKRGTSLRFTLSEAAKASIRIEKLAPGRRVGKSCLTPTKARAKKPKCTRYVLKGTLTKNATRGAQTVAFNGKLGGRALAAGSYRATVAARDAAGNTSKTGSVGFKIIRP